MQFSQLRNFLAVVDCGSIRGAARALRLSQPALTRSIRLLETELQSKLLERTTRGVIITPAGRAFFARARMIHHEVARAREELVQIAGGSAGPVSFGVAPQAAIHLVPAAISDFRSRYPTADLRIMDGLSHLLLPQLREGGLDFVIAPRPKALAEAAIESHPLFTNRLVVGARRRHPLRSARSLRELVDAQWVIFGSASLPVPVIPDVFKRHGLTPPKSVVRTDSYVALVSLLASTDAVGVLGHMFFEQPFARAYFEQFEIKERLPEVTVCLFLRSDSPLTPVADALANAVKAAAKRLALGKRAA